MIGHNPKVSKFHRWLHVVVFWGFFINSKAYSHRFLYNHGYFSYGLELTPGYVLGLNRFILYNYTK